MLNTIIRAVSGFVLERFPPEKLNYHSMIEKKEVPVHRMHWAYYMGGLALFFFIIQVVTGLLLIFYYQPTVSDAHASVQFLTEHVPNGALIRNMHAWSASCMILLVLLHLLTSFAMKAFGKPREVTWLAGVLLLFVTFVFGFSGYLLPWNQIAVNATKVVLQSLDLVGNLLPKAIAHFPTMLRMAIQGEPSVGQMTLSRFYVIHVLILPIALAALLAVHLLSVQLHGMSPGVDQPAKKQEKFFPFFILKDLAVWAIAFLLLYIVARSLPFDAFVSYPLTRPYNALGSTPDGIKPEWYFFFVYYPLEMLPFWVIALAMMMLVLALFMVPWMFQKTPRRWLHILASVGACYLIISTVFGETIYHLLKGGK